MLGRELITGLRVSSLPSLVEGVFLSRPARVSVRGGQRRGNPDTDKGEIASLRSQ